MARISYPRVMGHRGAAAEAPENTLVSIRHAADCGLAWVEFDTMLTGDDVPVLFHDDALARTTGAPGLMAETSFAELDGLDAGAWFGPGFAGEPVPSLEAAVGLVFELGLRANIEIKPSQGRETITAERVMETLFACWPAEGPPPLVSSFKIECLKIAQEMRPDWPRAFISRQPQKSWRAPLKAAACVGFHCYHKRLSAKTAGEVKAAGYALACFTVNEAARAKSLFDMGVDCVVSDDPRALAEALGQPVLG
jgi:glycerophosphoryl diester phosphodiesterase